MVLPTKGFYNIVNGSLGIATGAASSIPQWNLKEVNEALIKLLWNPDTDYEEIYCVPDFATGAYLINEPEVKEILKEGRGGSCKLRAVVEYDDKDRCLIVKEIPYGLYTNTICAELEAIEQSEDNPGIERHNDLTGKDVLIKIYLGKSINPDRIIRYLYKNTSLQYYVSINFTMLDNGRFPKVFTWKEMLQAHIDHEKEIYRRGFEYDLNKYRFRIHIIDGLFICLARIEEVVDTIKKSQSTADAKAALIKNFLLDADQAKAVLDMKLSRIANLEIKKLQDEKEELLKEVARIENILNTEELFNNEIINGWREVAKKYGDDRRTVIRTISTEAKEEVPDIQPEDCIIILTEGGTIKRVPSANYKPQKRNGKGIKTQDDITSMIIRTNTVDSLMVFSDAGKMYRLPVDDVPEGTNSSKGMSVKALVSMDIEENPAVIYSIYRDTDAKYVFFATKNGIVKKTLLDDYIKTRKKGGLAAISLTEGDALASVFLVKEEPVILVSKEGQVIKFNSTDINAQGRATVGVKGINLNEGDEITAALAVRDQKDALALFSEKGLGKKVLPSEIVSQKRGGKGVCCYKTSDNTGKVVCAAMVSDEDNLLVVGKTKSICVSAKELPALGRASIGNQILKDNNVISVSKI
jgi:DNA gyrase subunit A